MVLIKTKYNDNETRNCENKLNLENQIFVYVTLTLKACR